MKIYNSYIITVASLLLLTTVILVAFSVTLLEIYYVLYVVEALVITELYVYFSPNARRGLNTIGFMLFFGFVVIVSAETIKALM